ncbi:MAG TPA: hypothetical protein DDZ58_02915 [Achromobacter sp.]|nr:hypothetical protein DVB37_06020 [Achromobacter sp. B7]HBL65053.1 hypothetical protein [Achromobacter sp.]
MLEIIRDGTLGNKPEDAAACEDTADERGADGTKPGQNEGAPKRPLLRQPAILAGLGQIFLPVGRPRVKRRSNRPKPPYFDAGTATH